MHNFNPNLSKEDKDYIIKMSAVAVISTLAAEALRLGFEEIREYIKAKRKPEEKTVPAGDPANKTAPEEKKEDAK